MLRTSAIYDNKFGNVYYLYIKTIVTVQPLCRINNTSLIYLVLLSRMFTYTIALIRLCSSRFDRKKNLQVFTLELVKMDL